MGASPQVEGMGGPISVFFEVLPTSIQAIIPPIPSLRRSVSQRSLRAASFLPAALFVLQPQAQLPAADDDRVSPAEELDSSSPDEASSVDSSSVGSSAMEYPQPQQPQRQRGMMNYPPPTNPRRDASAQEQEQRQQQVVDYNDGGGGGQTSAPTTPTNNNRRILNLQFLGLGRNTTPATPVPDPPSGIDRKFQRRGQDLLRDSEAEADPANPDPNRKFERRAYLDGVAYLLQGLPRDLDDAEVSIIRGSLPMPLKQNFVALQQQNAALVEGCLRSSSSCSSSDGGGGQLVRHGHHHPHHPHNGPCSCNHGNGNGNGNGNGTVIYRNGEPIPAFLAARGPGPSPLHRTVQALVTALVVLLRLVVSIFIAAVQGVVRVGHEYQIPEKVLSQSIFLASSLASLSSTTASTIGAVGKASYAKLDEQVGNNLGASLASIFQWCIDESISGACSGVRVGFGPGAGPAAGPAAAAAQDGGGQ